jgi:beta-lactamase class A
MRIRAIVLALVMTAIAVLPRVGRAEEPLQAALRAQFEADLTRVAERLDGVMGFAIKDLKAGETFLRQPDTVFPQASSIKIAVLLELMRQAQQGELSLGDKHTVRRDETLTEDRDPILGMLGDGTVSMTVRDLAVFMVVLSDNSATNILIDRLGMERINAGIRLLGLDGTQLRRHMLDSEAARGGDENVSTPREMMTLLEKVHLGEALDAAHTREFLSILRLPKASAFHKALPSTAAIADKPGWLEGVRCDSGIVELPGRPFILSVMTTFLARDDEGEQAIEEVARLAFDYFDRLSRSSPYGRVISEP